MTGRPAPVRGRQTFAALQRSPRRAGDSTVRVHFAPSDSGGDVVSVAYAIGRRVGGAVIRNRLRRRVRAISAETVGNLAPGAYLVGLGPDALRLSFVELRERVSETMEKASKGRR